LVAIKEKLKEQNYENDDSGDKVIPIGCLNGFANSTTEHEEQTESY